MHRAHEAAARRAFEELIVPHFEERGEEPPPWERFVYFLSMVRLAMHMHISTECRMDAFLHMYRLSTRPIPR